MGYLKQATDSSRSWDTINGLEAEFRNVQHVRRWPKGSCTWAQQVIIKNYLQKIRLLLYIPTAMSFLLHCFRLVILFNIIENILIIYKRHGCNKDENPMTCCGQPGQVTTRRAWRSSSKNISKAQSESSLYHTFQLF